MSAQNKTAAQRVAHIAECLNSKVFPKLRTLNAVNVFKATTGAISLNWSDRTVESAISGKNAQHPNGFQIQEYIVNGQEWGKASLFVASYGKAVTDMNDFELIQEAAA